jgi:hypothetical protein
VLVARGGDSSFADQPVNVYIAKHHAQSKISSIFVTLFGGKNFSLKAEY